MWFWLIEEIEALRYFLGLGGEVLVALFFLTLMMWALLLERWLYFRTVYPQQVKETRSLWLARGDHRSWSAKQIRRELVSRVAMAVDKGMPIIKVLIALCPLMGLLGTVVGMVQVFDTLAITGTGSPRAMASGISKATVPTMAGMIAALSGLFFVNRLDHRAKLAVEKLEDSLKHG
ncbi:MotA/TolQ/ExbB proton channel family protein [Aeromonas simiae]|uniref:MotA/TolQ/ExbB proton channel family protein n=1 Tax=Aeromonas simiae TaxID=218936 RepID=UPI0005AA8610|nr:MotA/TolQ/ExbB proton channel family protein [Aeromonas simiae]MDO2948113.1 MotA/TolQ/ExbB proton channel family protein [Aeromonas simiae]MDO2952853.1 MotA/TolQ/ExbB proton channel family protein [Aeromonas simiae]MDO2955468.1 MotA/TolQ/ExbB proton channel family protein [Aeromonas simiae]